MTAPTQIDGQRPPTWNEMEEQINNISRGLKQWDHLCSSQLPSEVDKREFLATMSMFYERVTGLQNRYYDVIESVLRGYEIRKSRPDAFDLDVEYDRTIKIMKSLPDVKKKWLRHKK